jgi:hypothetical protein
MDSKPKFKSSLINGSEMPEAAIPSRLVTRGLTDEKARERFHEILKAFGTAIPTPATLDAPPPKRPALRCLD